MSPSLKSIFFKVARVSSACLNLIQLLRFLIYLCLDYVFTIVIWTEFPGNDICFFRIECNSSLKVENSKITSGTGILYLSINCAD